MKKLASIPLAFAVCLLVACAAFAQSAVISKSISTDLNAFADGGLTNGGELELSLNASLTAKGPDTLSAFAFIPPSTFGFSTDTLQRTEFSFASVNSASVNHTFVSGDLAGVTFNVTWTPVGAVTRATDVRDQDNQGGTFHFSQTASTAPATISGTVAGAQCCSFSFGTISQTASQNIAVIHP